MAFLLYPVAVVGAGVVTAIAGLGFYTCATEEDEEPVYFAPPRQEPVYVVDSVRRHEVVLSRARVPALGYRDDAEEERRAVHESLATANEDDARRRRARDAERRQEEAATQQSLLRNRAHRDPSLALVVHAAKRLDASWFGARNVSVVARAHVYDAGGAFVETALSRPSDGGDVGDPTWSRGAIRVDAALERDYLHRVGFVVELNRSDDNASLGRTAPLDASSFGDRRREVPLEDARGSLLVTLRWDDGLAEAVVGTLLPRVNPFVDAAAPAAAAPEGAVVAVDGRPVVGGGGGVVAATPAYSHPGAGVAVPVAEARLPPVAAEVFV